MMTILLSCYRRVDSFCAHTTGQTTLEYSMILGFIVLVALGAVAALSTDIIHTMDILRRLFDQDHVLVIDRP